MVRHEFVKGIVRAGEIGIRCFRIPLLATCVEVVDGVDVQRVEQFVRLTEGRKAIVACGREGAVTVTVVVACIALSIYIAEVFVVLQLVFKACLDEGFRKDGEEGHVFNDGGHGVRRGIEHTGDSMHYAVLHLLIGGDYPGTVNVHDALQRFRVVAEAHGEVAVVEVLGGYDVTFHLCCKVTVTQDMGLGNDGAHTVTQLLKFR